MYDYTVKAKVKHDKGIDKLGFYIGYATDIVEATKRATEMIMKSEDCPIGAIVALTVTLKNNEV